MGITYDSELQRFVFDFEHDGTKDIISMTGSGYQVEAFGHCFYYGYEFAEQVDGATSGSTLNEILRTLRILNEDNNIAIFSLIGRKDLMADTLK